MFHLVHVFNVNQCKCESKCKWHGILKKQYKKQYFSINTCYMFWIWVIACYTGFVKISSNCDYVLSVEIYYNYYT